MHYFELFSLPPALSPDRSLLRQRFFEQSRKGHPDYFVNEDAAKQEAAIQEAAVLNAAFKTLSNKDETIRYVLLQKGLMDEEEKYSLPQDFLMEMLDLSEAVSEGVMEGDAGAVESVKAQLQNWEEEIWEPVRGIVESSQSSLPSEAELIQVKDYYYKKKYLGRLSQQLAGML